jgi:DNA-binding NarL/FixJ family response regulator
MRPMGPTVLIVDDHAPFRERARGLLEAEGFRVVGDVPDGETAVAAARELRPQVVLLDIQLPGADGFAVAEELAGWPDPPAVVLISSRGAGAYRRRLEASAARGFIPKVELSGACLHALLD